VKDEGKKTYKSYYGRKREGLVKGKKKEEGRKTVLTTPGG